VAVTAGSQADLRIRVEQALDDFMAGQTTVLTTIDPELAAVARAVRDFLTGGKRLRPAFCYWGWRGAGARDGPEIVVAAASLELLHAAALIHDDLMDGSDTRRGQPAIHRRFAQQVLDLGATVESRAVEFGSAAAVLVGDLCLSWCDEMIETCGMAAEALLRAKPIFQRMRTEVMAGQYLDVLAQVTGGTDAERALRVVRFKSATYTVERPLHLGSSLAGGSPAVLQTYSEYGIPIGEAFQLRDDVLGVFGDPAETGKPAGDDLREGKRTLLVALAQERASEPQRAAMDRGLGNRSLDERGVDDLREILTETGALAEIEKLIAHLTGRALEALEGSEVRMEARDALRELAVAATMREG
jgi:geranylgeranyl diphosphate synthase, type I